MYAALAVLLFEHSGDDGDDGGEDGEDGDGLLLQVVPSPLRN